MKIAQPKLGKRLKRHHAGIGMNLSQGAAASGISKGHMHKIEAGGDIQLSTLNKILTAYKLRLIITNL